VQRQRLGVALRSDRCDVRERRQATSRKAGGPGFGVALDARDSSPQPFEVAVLKRAGRGGTPFRD
jgi:hypothetical protein